MFPYIEQKLYFDFELVDEPTTIDEYEANNNCYIEAGETYKYHAYDIQGVFNTRYVNELPELADYFDSMLFDYVDSLIEENGFNYDESADGSYYEQALAWISTNDDLKDTDTAEVIAALVNPELLTA